MPLSTKSCGRFFLLSKRLKSAPIPIYFTYMTKIYIVLGVALLLAFFAACYHWYTNQPLTLSPTPTGQQATSTPETLTPAPTTAVIALNERVQVGMIFVTPLEILEESRCPTDVVCIWAGTIRIKARIESSLGDSVVELKIDVPVTTEAETITLVKADPAPKAANPTPKSAYRFTITVAERED